MTYSGVVAMKFLDFDKDMIKLGSVVERNHYAYTVGAPIEVTAVRSLHKNELLAKKLSTSVKDDRLMTKYCPTNKIYFSRGVIDNPADDDFVSCSIDENNCCLYIGTAGEYGASTGILTFSGYLSANYLVEENKDILCTSRLRPTIMNHVRILSLGLRDGSVFGLFYIPCVKGIKVAERGSKEYGISSVNYKLGKCVKYQSFTVEDWFDELTRIREV